MTISELRDEFQKGLVDFLWDEWGQMGVSTDSRRRDDWAMDPEALLLLTFEVARAEPRLFEEVLDWMLLNEKLISVQRLRNLAEDEADRALVEAVMGWLGQNRRRTRLGARSEASGESGEAQPFFRDSRFRVPDPDPAFLAQGFLKPLSGPSGKSQAPDLKLPINLAFRLRLLLGIGVRAEVVRILLTVDAPWVNAKTLAEMTAYTKRNVQEAAAALNAADTVAAGPVGNENRFRVSQEIWARFLDLEGRLPRHENWPQIFRIWRVVLRWLADPANEGVSDYMLSSRARTLVESIKSDLLLDGEPVGLGDPTRDLAGVKDFVHGLTKGFV